MCNKPEEFVRYSEKVQRTIGKAAFPAGVVGKIWTSDASSRGNNTLGILQLEGLTSTRPDLLPRKDMYLVQPMAFPADDSEVAAIESVANTLRNDRKIWQEMDISTSSS